MIMVTDTSNSCENCCKSFSSKKNLRRHKINSCKEQVKKTDSPLNQTNSTPAMATVVPKSLNIYPNAVAVPTKKTVVAFECEYCNKLFRSKDALISHLKEHEEELEDDDEEEEQRRGRPDFFGEWDMHQACALPGRGRPDFHRERNTSRACALHCLREYCKG